MQSTVNSSRTRKTKTGAANEITRPYNESIGFLFYRTGRRQPGGNGETGLERAGEVRDRAVWAGSGALEHAGCAVQPSLEGKVVDRGHIEDARQQIRMRGSIGQS